MVWCTQMVYRAPLNKPKNVFLQSSSVSKRSRAKLVVTRKNQADAPLFLRVLRERVGVWVGFRIRLGLRTPWLMVRVGL